MSINKQLYPKTESTGKQVGHSGEMSRERSATEKEGRSTLGSWQRDVETLADKKVGIGPVWAGEGHVQTPFHVRRGVAHWASPV